MIKGLEHVIQGEPERVRTVPPGEEKAGWNFSNLFKHLVGGNKGMKQGSSQGCLLERR